MSRLDELYRARTRLAAEIFREEAIQTAASPVNSNAILAIAADLYDVTVEALLSPSRDARDVRARQAACWLLRAQGLSLPRIGAIVGRDHTTVMYACNKIDGFPAVRALLWPLLTKVA